MTTRRAAAVAVPPERTPRPEPGRTAIRRPDDADALRLAATALAELEVLAGTGEKPPRDVAERLGPILGHDLSVVRIHRDRAAGELATVLGAEAFSLGGHVWFAPGRYAPGTPRGRELLAHELAHAVTQPAPSLNDLVPGSPELDGRADDAIEEARADATAREAAQSPSLHSPADTPSMRPGRPLARRRAPDPTSLLTVLEPVRVLASLIGGLLQRNPSDRGGRLRAVVDHMEPDTRRQVVAHLRDRGGARWRRLGEVLRDERPGDGGTALEVAETAGDVDERPPANDRDQRGRDGMEGAARAAAATETERETESPGSPRGATGSVGAESGGIGTAEGAEKLHFDAEAELPPEPGPDELEMVGPDVQEETEADTGNGDDAPVEPATDAGASAPGPPAVATGGGAPAGGGDVDVEEELAEALEPALASKLPTDDEAAALVELQQQGDEDVDRTHAPIEAEVEEGPAPPDGATEPMEAPEPAGLDDMSPEQGPTTPVADAIDGSEVESPEQEPLEPALDAAAAPHAADPLADDAPPDDAPDAVEAPSTAEAAGGGELGGDLGTPGGGGACAPAPPAPMQDPPAGGGGCGGGGGGADADTHAAEAEHAAAAAGTPAAAVGAVAGARATARPSALESAGTAATTEVSDIQTELADGPPSLERPSGAPSGRDASLRPPALPAPGAAAAHPQPELEPAAGGTTPEEKQLPPTPPDVTARVPEPRLPGDTEISKEDVSKVRRAVDELPTSDPALNVDAGPAPTLVLDGEADPSRVRNAATGVVETTNELQQEANGHILEDLGDRDIYPHVPKETLTAQIDVATISIAPSGAGADTGKAPPVLIDRLAEEESGASDRAAIRKEADAMSTARTDHDTEAEQSRAKADEDLDAAVAANAGTQRELRQATASRADAARQAWVDDTATTSRRTLDATRSATTTADSSIATAAATARHDARTAVDDGNRDIRRARQDAESEAARHKAEAKKEASSGGFFSWLGSKVKSFFNKFKNLIKKAFDFARSLVDKAVKAAQQLAVAAIEVGRKAAIGAIELGGKALTVAGDIALAGFPEARDKWRSTIQRGVEHGKDAVNELADDLKEGVQAILDWLGKALKAALSALETVYTMAIEAVEAVAMGAIKLAKSVADAFGAFLAIAADIARGPAAWLKNLGAAAMDGARSCTWPAVKTAVKEWFRSKVEEIVGVGKAVFDVLLKGCISFAQVTKMAWAAIKASLPVILVQLLIEKLVAMLIPGGGAVSLIIDGLRAAWGAAGRILAAFQRFVDFLKAVRGGQAAGKFGLMIGAAATAVLDFLANFVLARIMGAGKKVGAALKKTADKIMGGLRKAAAATKRVAGRAVAAAKRTATAAAGAVKRGAGKVAGAAGAAGRRSVAAVKRTAGKAKDALAKSATGRAIIAGAKGAARTGRRLLDKGRRLVDKRRQKAAAKGKKKPKQKESPQQRLDRIVTRIRPTVVRWLSKGAPRLWLGLQLRVLRVRHRLSELRVAGSGTEVSIVAAVNPRAAVTNGKVTNAVALRQMVYDEVQQFVRQHGQRPPVAEPEPVHAAAQQKVVGGSEYLERPRVAVVDRPGSAPSRVESTVREYPSTAEFPEGKSSTEVMGPGTGTYGRMTRILERTAQQAVRLSGDKAVKLMNHVRALVRNRRSLPGRLSADDQRVIEGFATVFADAEAARSPVAEFYTKAGLDLSGSAAGDERSSPRELFSKYEDQKRGSRRRYRGGIFPPSMRGAENAMERAWREQTGRTTELDRRYIRLARDREYRRREREFIKRWAEHRFRQLRRQGVIIQNDTQMRAFIQRELVSWRPDLERDLRKALMDDRRDVYAPRTGGEG